MNVKNPEASEQPAILEGLRTHVVRYWQDEGQWWLDQLPARIEAICERWHLVVQAPLHGASTAYVALVACDDGSAAVLKIGYPTVTGEAEALRAFGTDLAIGVLAHEDTTLLLELCSPGEPLRNAASYEETVNITLAMMQSVWQCPPPPNIGSLVDECDRLRLLGQSVLHARKDLHTDDFFDGLEYLRDLPRSATRSVLLHGDLHPGNILSSTRRPWLVTDPRPHFGDSAYEPMQLIIELAPKDGGRLELSELVSRIDTAAARLELSPLRIAQWGVARRTDWALFCYGTGHEERAEAARGEMELFAEATRILQRET